MIRLLPLYFVCACALAGADTGMGKDGTADGEKIRRYGVGAEVCSPFDTPAFDLDIGLDEAACDAPTPTDGWIRISLWTDELPPTSGDAYSFTIAEGRGEASYFPPGGADPILATQIELSFDAVVGDELSGRYTLDFDDGSRLAGEYEAVQCSAESGC